MQRIQREGAVDENVLAGHFIRGLVKDIIKDSKIAAWDCGLLPDGYR
jgi:hypothetical protein